MYRQTDCSQGLVKIRTQVDGFADCVQRCCDVGCAFILALPGQLECEGARQVPHQALIHGVELATAACQTAPVT